MLKAIQDFPKQFTYNPVIKNRKKYKLAKKFIVLGMGGSHLAADILKTYNPNIELIIHCNYGLPSLSEKKLKEHLIIASSYSGNTEEVVDGLKKAHKKKLNVIIITTGGKLIRFAKRYDLPYIQMPNTGIQPRSALGFSIRAMLKAAGQSKALKETAILSKKLRANNYQLKGKLIAKQLKNRLPIIYSSEANLSLAYNWKIKFNETGKIPAFYNVFPELNHNEMNGFDVTPTTKKLTKNFYFIFLKDKDDHPKIIKRMAAVSKMYKKRGLPIIALNLTAEDIWFKLFSNLLLADWVAYYTAKNYGRDPEQVPMIEEFKKIIK